MDINLWILPTTIAALAGAAALFKASININCDINKLITDTREKKSKKNKCTTPEIMHPHLHQPIRKSSIGIRTQILRTGRRRGGLWNKQRQKMGRNVPFVGMQDMCRQKTRSRGKTRPPERMGR